MGSLLQITFHAAAKIALFYIAGILICLAGVRSVERFRGVGRRLPVTFGCFIFAALSLVGIPPFGGFVSKWYISLAALDGLPGAFAYVAPAVLLLSALLTAGYLFPPIIRGFFPGADLPETPGERLHEPWQLTVPLIFLAAVCGLLGLFPDLLTSVMQRIAGAVL